MDNMNNIEEPIEFNNSFLISVFAYLRGCKYNPNYTEDGHFSYIKFKSDHNEFLDKSIDICRLILGGLFEACYMEHGEVTIKTFKQFYPIKN